MFFAIKYFHPDSNVRVRNHNNNFDLEQFDFGFYNV